VNRAACLLIAALTCAGAPKPTPSWKTFADCAAAYQASANVKDPTRSALDQKSIQGFADDYRDTAFGFAHSTERRGRQALRQKPRSGVRGPIAKGA
jgi:hypothetical protein